MHESGSARVDHHFIIFSKQVAAAVTFTSSRSTASRSGTAPSESTGSSSTRRSLSRHAWSRLVRRYRLASSLPLLDRTRHQLASSSVSRLPAATVRTRRCCLIMLYRNSSSYCSRTWPLRHIMMTFTSEQNDSSSGCPLRIIEAVWTLTRLHYVQLHYVTLHHTAQRNLNVFPGCCVPMMHGCVVVFQQKV